MKIAESTRSRVTGASAAGVKNVDTAIQELQHRLPFGACASVFAFNRISRALWFLAVKPWEQWGVVFMMTFL